jgi:SPP1 gp7 family putative phage head morphogenesis protein
MAVKPTKFVNEALYDGSVRHAIYLESLKASQARAITRMLANDVYKPLLKRIKRRMATISTRGYDKQMRATQRLKELEESIRAQLRVGIKGLSKKMIKDLELVGVSEAEWTQALLKNTVPLDISFAAPSAATLRSIITKRPMEGKLLKDWFKQLSVDAQDKVIKGLNMGLTLGEGVPKIARRVALAGDLTKKNAIAISRTAINHVSTQARELTYAENADVVKGVEWVSTLDSRTTMRCISLDGKVFQINDGPRPPAHFQCRSTTVPITKSWKEIGIKKFKDIPDKKRESMKGLVPAKQTYPEWLKKQPAKFQREVLGATRYKLFKKGMPISKMVSRDFHPLTLNQIRKREGLKLF